MRIAIACMLVLLSSTQFANADVALNIVKVTPGAIAVGQTAVFNVSIFATPGGVTHTVDTVSFRINANDSGFLGNTNFGRFSAGTSPAPFTGGSFTGLTSSFVNFSASGPVVLSNPPGTPTLLATFTLDATNAIPNPNYSMGLTNFVATTAGGVPIPITGFPVSLTYSIVPAAVPEPSSLLLVVGAVGLVGARRYVRKRAV